MISTKDLWDLIRKKMLFNSHSGIKTFDAKTESSKSFVRYRVWESKRLFEFGSVGTFWILVHVFIRITNKQIHRQWTYWVLLVAMYFQRTNRSLCSYPMLGESTQYVGKSKISKLRVLQQYSRCNRARLMDGDRVARVWYYRIATRNGRASIIYFAHFMSVWGIVRRRRRFFRLPVERPHGPQRNAISIGATDRGGNETIFFFFIYNLTRVFYQTKIMFRNNTEMWTRIKGRKNQE